MTRGVSGGGQSKGQASQAGLEAGRVWHVLEKNSDKRAPRRHPPATRHQFVPELLCS